MDDPRAFALDKPLVRRAFERAAPGYERFAVLQREVESRLLERLDLLRAFAPATVLDVGAGTGRGTAALARRYRRARVVALDLAYTMLQRARATAPWWHRGRYGFVCGDMEALPVRDASVDLIFSNLCLQWSMAPDRVFAEFRRVLRPGGMVLFSTFGPDTLQELRAAWRAVDHYNHVNAFFDMHDLGDAMLRAGLADPVMDAERVTMYYPDLSVLMRDLKGLGSHNATAGRPRGLTGRGRWHALLEAGARLSRDGRLPVHYELVYGHAVAAAGAEVPVPVLRERP